MDEEPKSEEPAGWFGNGKPKPDWDAELVEALKTGVEADDEPNEKPVPAIFFLRMDFLQLELKP